jgi:PAS domain S-box-containing protein
MFGYQDGELIGQSTRCLFPDPESWAGFGADLYAKMRRGETFFGELQQRRKDGSLGWFQFSISLVKFGGDVVICAAIDVSARHRAEQALRDSEARYRAVVEDQTEVISRVTPDGTFVFVNEVYCRLFGKTSAELIGRRWQPVAHPDDLSLIEARLAELSPAQPLILIENRVWVASGELRWIQFVNRGFFDEHGRLREIQSVGRDITERKAQEARQAALLEDNQRLGQGLIELREQERRQLARELHDELSQQLVEIGRASCRERVS